MLTLAGVTGDVANPVQKTAQGYFVASTFQAGNRWSSASINPAFAAAQGATAGTAAGGAYVQPTAGVSAQWVSKPVSGYYFKTDPTAALASPDAATFIPGQGQSKLKSAIKSIAPIAAFAALPFAIGAVAGAAGAGASGGGLVGGGLSASAGGVTGLTAGSAGLGTGVTLSAGSGLGLSTAGIAGTAAAAGGAGAGVATLAAASSPSWLAGAKETFGSLAHTAESGAKLATVSSAIGKLVTTQRGGDDAGVSSSDFGLLDAGGGFFGANGNQAPNTNGEAPAASPISFEGLTIPALILALAAVVLA